MKSGKGDKSMGLFCDEEEDGWYKERKQRDEDSGDERLQKILLPWVMSEIVSLYEQRHKVDKQELIECFYEAGPVCTDILNRN
jgi:hypothetical protein